MESRRKSRTGVWTTDWTKLKSRLNELKYPLLVLLIGVVLMLLPTGEKKGEAETCTADQRIQELLCRAEGVGQVRVLISENGVVVLCQGADNAKARLDIIKAVSTYTGFGADKITVLKLTGST